VSASPERDLVQLPLASAAAAAHGFAVWAGSDLPRSDSDVIVAKWCADQILLLNPWLTLQQASDAVKQLEAVLASTTPENIVERSKTFLAALRTGVQIRVGNRKKSVVVLDLDNPAANRWDIATEVMYKTSGGTRAVRFDIVVYGNGIPLVVTECKSMTDPNISWINAAKDITGTYTNRAPGFLAASLFQVATDGRDVRYGPIKAKPQQFHAWGSSNPARPADETWDQVEWDFCHLHDPALLCAWVQDHILHLSDRSSGTLTRFIPRWPQAEAAPLMAERSRSELSNRGLLVHYQGSGKTLAMLMTANEILRRDPKHCVVLVVDRIDLLSQHKQDFLQSDARRSVQEAATGEQLAELLRAPATSGLVITMVHRFADKDVLSTRSDITVLVDEAHRTQGTSDAQLGGQMRKAIPNATLIGLTGTPVSAKDRNTFEAFGSDADKGYVMHRYTPADSVKDGTTVQIVVDRRRIVQTLQRDELDAAYAAYVETEGLSSEKAEILARQATRWDALLKDPRRIQAVCADVAADLVANVLPGGYGAMLVVADRAACVMAVTELRKHLNTDQVTAVISGDKSDPASFEPFIRTAAQEAEVVKAFRDPAQPLKLLVVTSKLLTGFDAKNCLAIYIDKPLKGHTLFQAVARVNRTWVTPSGTEKGFGIVVDYCGVAPEILRAFDQTVEDSVRKEVVSPTELVASYKRSLTSAEKVMGEEFSWTVPRHELIISAKRHLSQHPKLVRAFRQHVNRAELIFEALPNNAAIAKEKHRLQRLVLILDSYGISQQTEREALLLAHGPAVRALVFAHTGAPQRADLELLQLSADRIAELVGVANDPAFDVKMLQSSDVLDRVRERLRARMNGPHAQQYSSIAAKLEVFASTVYVETPAGVQQATIDLVEIAKQLKTVDDLLGEHWEDLDLELFGWRKAPAPVLDPKYALQQLLDEYGPNPLPAGLDDVAKVVDDIVGTLSYKSLRDDVSAQKSLTRMLLTDCKRIGVLPTEKIEANEFIAQLVAYVNAYLV
jgi:type I restriction enzyme R subunit